MARKVVWTEPALNDLDAIADYIALDKPFAARFLIQGVFKKVESLSTFSRLGAVPRELKNLPYRQLSISPCRIFYRIQAGTIYIVAVIRGERRLVKSLLNRQ